MEFNEIVEHEVQLRHVETIKINAEKKKEYVENTLSIRASTKGEVIDNKTGYSSLYVIVENDGYILEVNKRGKFQFSNKEIKNSLIRKYYLSKKNHVRRR